MRALQLAVAVPVLALLAAAPARATDGVHSSPPSPAAAQFESPASMLASLDGVPPVTRCRRTAKTVDCLTIWSDVRDARSPGVSQSFHQFWSQQAPGCSSPVAVVCARGSASMAFDTGCPGEAPANSVCLGLTGEASATGAVLPGRLDARLGHMTGLSCTWPLGGGGCAGAHTDPDTGALVHKHWHAKENRWQIHCGSADASSSDLTFRARGFYGAAYRFGPVGGGFPNCAP